MIQHIVPELILLATALGVVFSGVVLVGKNKNIPFWQTQFGYLSAFAAAVLIIPDHPEKFIQNTMMVDSISQYIKALLIFCGLVLSVFGYLSKEMTKSMKLEFYVLTNILILAACILTSAIHFVPLYVALELVFLILFILIVFSYDAKKSSEASAKFLIFNSVSSLFFVLAVVLMYGYTKEFNIFDIQAALRGSNTPLAYFSVVFALLFIGFATKVSMFPFQLNLPAVVYGASMPVAALLCTIPLVIGFVLITKFFLMIFGAHDLAAAQWTPLEGYNWVKLMAVLIAVSMTFSNLVALVQKDIKRLFAYVATSNISFLLLGFVILNEKGLSSMLFGLSTYCISVLGSLLVIMLCVNESKNNSGLNVIKGLVWKKPWEAVLFCLFVISLAGVPPFVGFTGKVYLLSAVIEKNILWLAMVAGVNIIVGLKYYFHLLQLIFEKDNDAHYRVSSSSIAGVFSAEKITLGFLAVPTILAGLYWDSWVQYIFHSLKNILW